MTEVYVLVEKKKTGVIRFLTYFVLGLTLLLCALSVLAPIMMAGVVIFAAIWYVLQFRTNVEYECSYFDGDVRFARVMNKSRRKRLRSYTMEHVLQIAPAGDRSVFKYENDKQIKRKNYTSGKKDVPYYEMIVKDEDGITMISFEPDDKYLDAVCVKYSPKVIRR